MKAQCEIDPDAPFTLVEKLALAVLAAWPYIFVKAMDALT